ncbi:hypothetical protein JCM33374_g1660 [Metschnikowia sp. JCM 33374]|nr:hypothetical protein JCM33374_g1660 [Metschnikowia sp. JCM 33374]
MLRMKFNDEDDQTDAEQAQEWLQEMDFLIVSSEIVDEQQKVLACIRNLTDWVSKEARQKKRFEDFEDFVKWFRGITTTPAKNNNTNNNRGRGRRFNQGRNSNSGRNFHYGQPTSNPNSQSVQGNRDYMNNTRLAQLGLFQGDDEQFGDENAPLKKKIDLVS